MKSIESRLTRAEKWVDARKPIPSFVVVGVVKEGVSLDDVSSFLELIDHEVTIAFDELFNDDGSIRECYQFKRFLSCNLSDIDRLLNAFEIEAQRAAKDDGKRMEW